MKLNKLLLGALLVGAVLAFASLSAGADSKSKSTKIVLTDKNTVTLNDQIDADSVSDVITKANALCNSQTSTVSKLKNKVGLSTKKEKLRLFLRTPGGGIQAGMEMFEALKGLDCEVDTITLFSASMGFQTVQALGKRYIVNGGVLMSHRASGGFEGSFGGKPGSPMDNRKRLWEQRILEMDKQTVARTNGKQTLESYQSAYAEELWLTGPEAVEQGYADEVVTVSCDESLNGVDNKKITFMGIPITYDVSKCPLDSSIKNVEIGLSTNKGQMTLGEFNKAGGQYGSTCLQLSGTNPNLVCALDTSLTVEKVNEVTLKFKNYYDNIRDRVIQTVIP